MQPTVKSFFHNPTSSFTHVIYDTISKHAAIIDPVLDFHGNSGHIEYTHADQILEFVNSEKLHVKWILETHVHADHVTAADYLKGKSEGCTGIGGNILNVQSTFKNIFNLQDEFNADGLQFDHLFAQDELFHIGQFSVRVINTPGHTNDSITYVVGNSAFIGDTLLMPDYGTARCDFPGGDAHMLYQSIQKILSLGDSTRLYVCHDYIPDGSKRNVCAYATVAEQKANNIHIHEGVTEDDFVKMRVQRDSELDMPTLIIPSIQLNIRAGQVPGPEKNGVSYLKFPLNCLGK